MDSNDDHRPLAAADDDDHSILGYEISRFLILNTPEPPYGSEDPKVNWLHLPQQVLATILLKLGAIEIIGSAQKVCTLWRSACMDPSLWTHINMGVLDCQIDVDCDLAKMCRHAIDRSRGGCVDINIEYFGDDDLLNYIIESGCKLRRLRLECCWSVSDKGMVEAAPRLSFLETFEYYNANSTSNALEAIGKNCPHLTTLVYELEIQQLPSWGKDDQAFNIAKHMPGLRHLSLLGNNLTNKGLGAILDGCPHLESLDLRRCSKIDLKDDDLAKKCQRIKDLKLPRISTASDKDFLDYYLDSVYYDLSNY